MVPGTIWRWGLVAAPEGIAAIASAAALLTFLWLRRVSDQRGLMYQTAAAVVMGLAISGLHYTSTRRRAFPRARCA